MSMSVSIVPQLVNWDGGNRKGSYGTYNESSTINRVIKDDPLGIAEEYSFFETDLETGEVEIDVEGGTIKTIKTLAIRELKSASNEFKQKISDYHIVAWKKDSNCWIIPGRIKNLIGLDYKLAIEREKKSNNEEEPGADKEIQMLLIQKESNLETMSFTLYYSIREAFNLPGSVPDVQVSFSQDNAPLEKRIEQDPMRPKLESLKNKDCCVIL